METEGEREEFYFPFFRAIEGALLCNAAMDLAAEKISKRPLSEIKCSGLGFSISNSVSLMSSSMLFHFDDRG